MTQHHDAWLRHQQQRFMRPDAARYIRPDAGRFLRPGTDPASVYPALAWKTDVLSDIHKRRFAGMLRDQRALLDVLRRELNDIQSELESRRAFGEEDFKANPNQRRVPKGNRFGGRWTRDGAGDGNTISAGADGARTDASQSTDAADAGALGDGGDLLPTIEVVTDSEQSSGSTLSSWLSDLFGDTDATEMSGDLPPEIPQQRPSSRDGRMGFVRTVANWIGRIGRYSPFVTSYLGALEQLDQLKALTDLIRTSNDAPKDLEQLQDPVGSPSQAGYHDHHLAEEQAARDSNFPESLIQGRDNLVRIPALKHIDITSEYMRKVEQPDGRWVSPREFLQTKDFETRRQYGLAVLRRHGVLK